MSPKSTFAVPSIFLKPWQQSADLIPLLLWLPCETQIWPDLCRLVAAGKD
jgi:hypothetical protein